jgi:hypothetical protein
MKQVEILDLLLKGLYEEGKDDYRSLAMIINKNNIPVETIDELRRLAKRLENDGLIGKPIFTRTDISARLTSYGVDYCEGDSYTYSGSAIINNTYNINIENSSDTTIVSQSEHVKINLSQSDIKNELSEIVDLVCLGKGIEENAKKILSEKLTNLINKL